MVNSVVWSENFKLRIANSSESFQKHEVVKLLTMMKLIEKHKSHKNWIRIYSELELENGLIPDLYYENVKEKSIICYEVQKNLGSDYVAKKTKQYNELDIPYFNSVDLIIIPIKNAPNDLEELNKWLEQFIF